MKKYNIFVVDDVISNLKTIVEYLERANDNYQVFSTANSKLALKVIEEKELDLVITDWRMPEVSGLDLIRHFKESHPFKKPPFIVITGTYTRAEDLKIALDTGALDFIRKPINKLELQARVAAILKLFDAYKIIDQQNDEVLSTKTLKIHEKNQALLQVRKNLEKYMLSLNNSLRRPLKEILKSIPLDSDPDQEWNNFRKGFEQIHPHFFKRLQNICKDLRPFELKMCTYIRVGFKIKEIASFLNIEYGGARVQKSRIKKKLKLPDNISLDDYLQSF